MEEIGSNVHQLVSHQLVNIVIEVVSSDISADLLNNQNVHRLVSHRFVYAYFLSYLCARILKKEKHEKAICLWNVGRGGQLHR